MKYAILFFPVILLLSSCGLINSDNNLSLISPDVKKYPQTTLNRAADEIDGGKCPVLSEIMMPDYYVCRQQSREISK